MPQETLPPVQSHPKPRPPRHILVALLVTVLTLCIALAFWYQQPQASAVAAVEKSQYSLIPVQRGDIEQTIAASGKLQLFKYADVGSLIAGQVNDVFAVPGDDVHAGKLLFNLIPSLPTARAESNDAQLARLQAELSEQQAQMDFAELQFKRQTQLKADNATREESYEASRATMYTATARVEAIKAQIRQIESTIRGDEDVRNHTQVSAPIAGTVISVAVRPGQMINPNQANQVLVRIADLSRLTVQARVAETDVPHLRPGMGAYFSTPAYPGRRWFGKLRLIIPTPAEGSGEQGKESFYNVLFEVNNPDRQLMSGMSTQVNFVLNSVHDTLLLPLKALGNSKPDADGAYTLKVMNNQHQTRVSKVKFGLRDQQHAQVLSGLIAGEQIVVPGTAHPTAASNAVAVATVQH